MSEIHFASYDPEAIANEALSVMQETLGVDLGLGDERRLFLLQIVQFLVATYAVIDDAGRQNLLENARGDVLNAIGDGRGVSRLEAVAAQTTLRFTLSTAQSHTTTIPAGTRATPDGEIFFALDLDLTIAEGNVSGAGKASCLSPGAAGNGHLVGTINLLVDPVPFIESVANENESSGGADTESDDAYRERIRLSPSGFSTTGPSSAYVYWARSASANVIDVSTTSPAPGEVLITVLLSDGAFAQDILDAVYAACNDYSIRPLTDFVQVQEAAKISFDIDIKYYAPFPLDPAIVTAIEGEGGAIEQYVDWQCNKIGRAINPDYLRMLIIRAGAVKVDITTPQFAQIGLTEVAHVDMINVVSEEIEFE